MSSSPPAPVDAPAGGPGPERPSVSSFWTGLRREFRGDLRAALLTALALAVAGLPAGLLWWALAPRADFRITPGGPSPIGDVSPELLAADDAIFAVVLAGLGLVAGVVVWFLRRRRGVAMLLALAVGGALAAVLAWQFGQLLGPGPTHAELTAVGTRVTTGLSLESLPALAVAPFFAVLPYVVGAIVARHDDLGRRDDVPRPPEVDPAVN